MASKEVQKKAENRGHEPLIRPLATVSEEAGGNIVIRLEMPGVSKENLDLDVDANELHITGRRPVRADAGEVLLRERPQGSFRQIYTLDDTIDRAKIDAVLESGVLTLTLSRKEAVKPRRIPVRA